MNKIQQALTNLQTAIRQEDKDLAIQQANVSLAEMRLVEAVEQDIKEEKKKDKLTFVCPREGCDNRPFFVTQKDLDEAEGWIACDVCGGFCVQGRDITAVSPAKQAGFLGVRLACLGWNLTNMIGKSVFRLRKNDWVAFLNFKRGDVRFVRD